MKTSYIADNFLVRMLGPKDKSTPVPEIMYCIRANLCKGSQQCNLQEEKDGQYLIFCSKRTENVQFHCLSVAFDDFILFNDFRQVGVWWKRACIA